MAARSLLFSSKFLAPTALCFRELAQRKRGGGGAEVENRLTSTHYRYDEAAWSARTWLSVSAQQISVAVRVDSAKGHVAETAPFPAPTMDLDKSEHAIRRISTPPVTMGGCRTSRSSRLTDLV